MLVMAVLTITLAIAAPALARFFRGRTLDSEARQLLALTRQGQSRAVSEGLPVELWLDPKQSSYGLECAPDYETVDPKAQEFTLDKDLQLEVIDLSSSTGSGSIIQRPPMGSQSSGSANLPVVRTRHPNLQVIRFLPDGTLGESSPQRLRLVGRDGSSLWVALARNRLSYEIQKPIN
jgi:type II secretory pathway pseudopilin PulG